MGTQLWAGLGSLITIIALVASALIAWAIYTATRAAGVKREALHLIQLQLNDKDWIADDAIWSSLRAALTKSGSSQSALQVAMRRYASLPGDVNDSEPLVPTAYDLRDGGPSGAAYREDGEARWLRHRKVIQRRLNRYEMVAIAIRKGAIDEDIYKIWWQTTLLKDFIWHIVFIDEVRKDNLSFFKQYHWLAYRWATPEQKRVIVKALGMPDEYSKDWHAFMGALDAVLARWRLIIPALLILLALLLGYWVGSQRAYGQFAPGQAGESAQPE